MHYDLSCLAIQLRGMRDVFAFARVFIAADFNAHALLDDAIRNYLDNLLIISTLLRQPQNGSVYFGAKLLAEERHEFVPHAVATETRIGVRGIMSEILLKI